MIKLYESELPHFAQGVINGWHEAKTKEPLFYQVSKISPGQRQAYVMGWKYGKKHHNRPYLNYACRHGIEAVKHFLTAEKVVVVGPGKVKP